MNKILAVALLLAACGGSESEAEADNEPTELCQTYQPSPERRPGSFVTTCVPLDWERDGFCWRTEDDTGCFSEGAVAHGCAFVSDTISAKAGDIVFGCIADADRCLAGFVDNPADCH